MLKNKLEKLNEELLDDYTILSNIFKTQTKEAPKVDGEMDSK